MHRIAAKVIALRGTQNRMVCALPCALEIALNKTRPAMSSANSHSRRSLHVAAEGATLWEFHLQSGGVELKTCWKWCKGKKRAHSASEKGLIRKEKRLKWNVEKKILIRTPSIACFLRSSLSLFPFLSAIRWKFAPCTRFSADSAELMQIFRANIPEFVATKFFACVLHNTLQFQPASLQNV